jgi:hypothetical protein
MNAWVLALMALLGSLGLAQKPLKTLAWGSYSLRIEENEGGQVARILLAGRTLVEVRDFLLEVSLVEVTGRPPKELLLTGYSGGAHCCTTHYLFTQEGGLRNLLYQEWGDGGIQEVRDLDGDGRGALRRDLRERPLRGGGGRRHHPHLPLNRRSPRPYPAPSPVGRGTLTRDPAGVGAPADLAGTRPLVGGASPLHKSALSQNGGPAPSAEGASGRPPPLWGPSPK